MSYTKENELMDEKNIFDEDFQKNYISMIILRSI